MFEDDKRGTYWARRSRRRFLGAAGGGMAVLGLAAAGCGDDDKPSGGAKTAPPGQLGGGTPTSGSSTAAASASAAATQAETIKTGGKMVFAESGDPVVLDPSVAIVVLTRQAAGPVYSRLLQYKRGPGVNALSGELTGDVAESYEVLDGGARLSFKLNPKAKWHAPISRQVVGDDIVYGYQRFIGKIEGGKPVPNAGLYTGYIESVTAPDKGTVVIKLNKPNFQATNLLVEGVGLYLMPPETGKAFDPTKTMVGSSAWLFDTYTPGTNITYKRNPEWHLGDGGKRPYLDRIEIPFLPDAQVRATQFAAGNVDTTYGLVPSDFLRILEQVKNVQYSYAPVGFSSLAFSPKDGNPLWKDLRIRQAISMGIDRDGLNEGIFDLKRLQNAGIKIDSQWMNFVPPKNADYWLDPKGPNMPADLAKVFKYDPAEAKKLLAAAGVADGFSAAYRVPPAYGANYTAEVELITQMLAKIGIKLNIVQEDLPSVYTPKTRTGDFDGLALLSDAKADPVGYIENFMTKTGLNTARLDDAELERRVTDINATFDTPTRKTKLTDIQKYLCERMPMVPTQSSWGPRFTVYQANIRNLKDYQALAPGTNYAAFGEGVPYYWKA